MILLDTSVLSRVLRRGEARGVEAELAERVRGLLSSGERVGLPGVVLQEVLSGIKETSQFARTRRILLEGYAILTASPGDHVLGADLASQCRRQGISTSVTDALIAATAINARAQLFTTDADFRRLATVAPLRLYAP